MATLLASARRTQNAQPVASSSNGSSYGSSSASTKKQSTTAAIGSASSYNPDKEFPYIKFATLAFSIGASAAEKFWELLKEKARVAAPNKTKTFQAFYRIMMDTMWVEEDNTLSAEEVYDNTITRMLPMLAEFRKTGVNMNEIQPLLNAVNKKFDQYDQPDQYSFLLLLAAMNGIRSTISKVDIELMRQSQVVATQTMPQDTPNQNVLVELMMCSSLITRSIIKFGAGTDEKEAIGESVYYMANRLAQINEGKSASRAILDYFETRWVFIPASGKVQFRKALAAESAAKYIAQIVLSIRESDIVSGIAGLNEKVIQTLYHLLFAIELYLYKSDGSFLLVCTNAAFVNGDTPYSSALLGGWYGLKYGIMDQEVDPQKGVTTWAIKYANQIKPLVDTSAILIE